MLSREPHARASPPCRHRAAPLEDWSYTTTTHPRSVSPAMPENSHRLWDGSSKLVFSGPMPCSVVSRMLARARRVGTGLPHLKTGHTLPRPTPDPSRQPCLKTHIASGTDHQNLSSA